MPAPTVHKNNKTSSSLIRDPPPHKTRIVRRRGRAQDGIYSDDEIEREARSDSESDSSLDSASDSETEPASEDAPTNGHADVLIPSSTHIPQPDGVQITKASQGPLLAAAAVDWSDMVADEAANGTADLPVIDFAELDAQSMNRKAPPRPRKAPKAAKRPTPARTSSAPAAPPASSAPVPEPPASPEPSTSHPEPEASRRPGQTARQAYQERLESDPSYVPTVGEFWGHDDRLLDKGLRPLSGWWRGRWQGGSRGRGGFGMRGRGGFFAARHEVPPPQEGEPGPSTEEVPPVERAWTHDGFEEMKKREERRTQDGPQRGFRGGFRGGRGGFVPGRGRGFVRGGFSPVSSYARPGAASPTTRTWFAMKPERVWTKHHELFLYSDPALKPRPGQGPGYRIKLPGKTDGLVVRTAPSPWPQPAPARTPPPSTASTPADADVVITVRLPQRAGKERAAEPESKPALRSVPVAVPVRPVQEPVMTVSEPPIDDPFTIRRPPPPTVIPLPPPAQPVASGSSIPVVPPIVPAPSGDAVSSPGAQHMETDSSALWNPQTSGAQERAQGSREERPAPPVLPPLQTAFTPIPQPSPSFGSPYGYPPALPPGIAVNQHGMPYELSTGRPVYIQPAPAPMYPQPVLSLPPGIPFVPHHVHHHSHPSISVSPDFLSHSPTPPTFGEAPIFAPPRQSSRIEIRKPTTEDEGKKSASPRPRGPSHLRSSITRASISAPVFSPAQQHPAPEYFRSPAYAMQAPEPVDASMMGYAAYQQQYYYPEQYGYPPYVEVPQQSVQYEGYASDPRAPQPAYY
ncbi:hypothetical protein BV25DRAFT_1830941 [Artomyces pyxidatus]|uniref:Uncharacterized protein n=1 Tax=Artomyces pyxidatus TaxID=48021 RepID=A0ACB8SMP2_9AGAM|nr:hypothetical protein BV25DRAFT_1830941 [Artomyces pyxidatus]